MSTMLAPSALWGYQVAAPGAAAPKGSKKVAPTTCPSVALRVRATADASSPSRLPVEHLEVSRRNLLPLSLGLAAASGLSLSQATPSLAVGLPQEDDTSKRLCTGECEAELEKVPIVTLPSGLQYKEISEGKGPSPLTGFQVATNYVAMLPDGRVFGSSLSTGNPYIIRIGAGQVIAGLDEGILTMKAGGRRRLYIPGEMAFPKGLGSAPGRPRVPPASPVVFDVELLYIPGVSEVEEYE